MSLATPTQHRAAVIIGGTLSTHPVLLTPGYTTKHDVARILALALLGSVKREDDVLVERLTCRTCGAFFRLDSLDTTGECEPCALGEQPRDEVHGDVRCGECGERHCACEDCDDDEVTDLHLDDDSCCAEDDDDDPVAQERAGDAAASTALRALLKRHAEGPRYLDTLLLAEEVDAIYRALDALDN